MTYCIEVAVHRGLVLTLYAFKVKKKKERKGKKERKKVQLDHGERATEPTYGTVTAGVY